MRKAIGVNGLNVIYVNDEVKFNGHHEYEVCRKDTGETLLKVHYQEGARLDPNSIPGILDLDLMYMIRDRIQTFQKGEFACRENALVLTKIEEAIMWAEKRVKDREERGVLGTYNK